MRENFVDYELARKAYLSGKSRSLRKFLNSPDLSVSEKRLLQSRLLIKKGHWREALDLLNSFTPQPSFLKAERDSLIGNLHSFSGRWQEAIVATSQAVEAYKTCEDRLGLFNTHYNLSVFYGRIGRPEKAYHHLGQAAELAASADEHVTVLRAEACALSRDLKFKEAMAKIHSTIELGEALNDVDRNCTLTVAVDILTRAGRLEEAYSLVETLGKKKASREQPRVLFYTAVLKRLLDTKSLDMPVPPAIVRKNTEYCLQWNILRYAARFEQDRMEAAWLDLVHLRPQVFAENFQCVSQSDNRTAFMRLFSKILESRPRLLQTPNEQAFVGKLGRIHSILLSASVPLSKEFLVEAIWSVPYVPSCDGRFYKLLERLRRMGVQVNKRHQYYYLST